MKKLILLIFLSISGIHYSQTKFESGYIIDNTGKKYQVYIKNSDWMDNPKEIDYKITETGEILKGNLASIREFGIKENIYVNKTVEIDKSSEKFDFLSETEKPVFKSETLFLNKIVNGKASLYYYKEKNITRYFYSIDDSNPEQLIYKAYKYNNSSIGYNNEFKNQIKDKINCNLTNSEINSIKYENKSLERVFLKFNQCNDGSYEGKKNKNVKRDWINLSIRPGINQSKFSLSSSNRSDMNDNFDSNISFRMGVELEFVLPYNNGRWRIIAEPNFSSYKSEKITESPRIFAPSVFEKRTVNYSGIQLPIGLRYYVPINNSSQLFTNISYTIPISGKTDVNYEFNTDLYSNRTGQKFEFGIGYKYIDKFSSEIRFQSNQDLVPREADFSSKLQSFSLILGYTLF
ncbi:MULTISPECIES: outer membrane beta-barrel protein [Chryseobacterium]|uniref:Outer membrane protein beta-barrel domain-containing protein n=1 Tax=Chryseobacterium taihuense TaxID=1141221 RepID=A0A4U8WQX0_9FLAO|nr:MULTISPECIES: outer membrane beta-barrel protein [Chryseobacterium]QQV01398.1 PorT family protein [Chryseobacterium sp. FDAARGOS 1104]VFB05418.1 Uncharacterised protein [Chryseobacterium taihuense]